MPRKMLTWRHEGTKQNDSSPDVFHMAFPPDVRLLVVHVCLA